MVSMVAIGHSCDLPQEHTAVVFAEEVRGLHQQLQEIKSLLESSWQLDFDSAENLWRNRV